MEYEQLNLAEYGSALDDTPTIYSPKGCPRCNGSGYIGRSGIYEFITLDSTFRSMVHDIGAEQELEEYARKMSPSIRQDGIRLVLQGRTTLEEVMRVTREN
jgi:general secretion pathway protein E